MAIQELIDGIERSGDVDTSMLVKALKGTASELKRLDNENRKLKWVLHKLIDELRCEFDVSNIGDVSHSMDALVHVYGAYEMYDFDGDVE